MCPSLTFILLIVGDSACMISRLLCKGNGETRPERPVVLGDFSSPRVRAGVDARFSNDLAPRPSFE